MALAETNGLTARQAERRQRVLRAASDLASEGGYDAVQVREVANRAEVALGTVYHYFKSKDHLLAALLLDWLVAFEQGVEQQPAEGDAVLDRVTELLARATRSMQANPDLTAAVMTGFSSPGPEIAACESQLHETMARVLGSAFPIGVDERWRLGVIRTLEHVWYSVLLGWVNGWMPFDQARDELEQAAWVLLADA